MKEAQHIGEVMELNKIYNLNCLEGLKLLPDNCIDCCVTSPPYFGLRDYNTGKWEGSNNPDCEHWIAGDDSSAGEKQKTNNGSLRKAKDVCPSCGAKRIDEQIGLEETPELFVAKMAEVFTEVRRVLKHTGTLWLNLGDSYAASGGKQVEQSVRCNGDIINEGQNGGNRSQSNNKLWGVKPKDLIGIPWMVAFALRSAGYYLRQDIIWAKPNPMPESVTDRCTKSHEYIFLLSKSQKYYYDAEAIKQGMAESSMQRLGQDLDNQIGSSRVPGKTNGTMKAVGKKIKLGEKSFSRGQANGMGVAASGNGTKDYYELKEGANKRSVWTVTTKPFSEAHFATFPEDLIVDMIKAGCPEGGIVIDPFMGAGTTALVSAKLHRNFIGFELNPDYIKIAEKRLKKELGMFHPEPVAMSAQYCHHDGRYTATIENNKEVCCKCHKPVKTNSIQ